MGQGLQISFLLRMMMTSKPSALSYGRPAPPGPGSGRFYVAKMPPHMSLPLSTRW
jgi:hypothetical protein